MLKETLIEVTRRQRNQSELEAFAAYIKDEVENFLGQEIELKIRAGNAESNELNVNWEVGASKFSADFYINIRPKEDTELDDPDIVPKELLRRPVALLWLALGELGFEQFARFEDLGAGYELYRLRNRIAESDNFVAFFEIPLSPVRLEDC